MTELKRRDEIEEKYKWRLEDIFESDEVWESELKRAELLAKSFREKRGSVCESSESLLSALSDYCELSDLLASLSAYSFMRSDENNDETKYRVMNDRAGNVASACAAEIEFLETEIIAAGKERIKGFVEDEAGLSVYAHYFEDLFRRAEHKLSEECERLLALSYPVAENASDIFSALNDADFKFGTVEDKNGDEIELTQSRYGLLLESGDRVLRKNAYSALYAQYKAHKTALAASFAGNIKSDLFYATARKYPSTINMRLSGDNISESVYERLISVVSDGISELSEYMELRRRRLNLDKLCMYDLYTPIVQKEEKKIGYEEACEMVLEAVAPLGEQYVSDMRAALDDRWVDVFENKGKSSGAYSYGDNNTHPFVLLNYQGGLDDVFTLAHEMGHAMHSFYTSKAQPSIYKDYKIFVAEVASTVNENLLLEYLLKKAEDKNERAYLLNKKLEEIRTTFFRQTMFAEFEKKTHEVYKNGGALSHEILCDMYAELNRKYYPSVETDEDISYEWARIPHFYSSFYVYQYATGYAAAVRIKDLILGGESPEKYLRFLAGGDSEYPLKLLSDVGVDLASDEAFLSVIEEFKRAREELAEI